MRDSDTDQALLRRHAAAMTIIADTLPGDPRWALLALVLTGAPELDAVVEAAEQAGRPFPKGWRQGRRAELTGGRR